MTPDLAAAVYDALLGREWRESRLVSGNRRVRCPLHEDAHPSLDVHPEKLGWVCRAGCGGGGAFDFAVRLRGEEGARALLRELEGGAPSAAGHAQEPKGVAPSVEVLSPPTSTQIAALQRTRRLCDAHALERIGARLLRVWGEEWLGIPNLASGWKCWALNRNGIPRRDEREA